MSDPPAKKAKTDSDDWKNHTLNCASALVKADEGSRFSDLKSQPVAVLQGIGPVSSKVLDALKIETVEDLANYKFFLLARAIQTMETVEEKGDRPDGSAMNIDKAVDKAYETKSFKEILEAPISALEGLSDKAEALLGELGVKTIGDLASFKYCRWAESIVTLASFEETETSADRKASRLAKQLS